MRKKKRTKNNVHEEQKKNAKGQDLGAYTQKLKFSS
jgi:hypothetical protein